MSDRLVRFPGQSWQEIEALLQPLPWTVPRTIFHLLDEPVPALASWLGAGVMVLLSCRYRERA